MNDQHSQIGNTLDEIKDLLDIKNTKMPDTIDYAWYVGAAGNDDEGVYTDFSDQYIDEGRWENRWDNKFTDVVKSMKVGDRIALKSSYTRKNDLPFEANGKSVSVMGIKAIGTVTDNPGDGKNIKVDWTKCETIKEWYGKGVLRSTIHKIVSADGLTKKLLLQFTFDNVEQDYSLCEEQYSDDIEENEEIVEEIIAEKLDDMSVEELGEVLETMYANAKPSAKTTSVHMFGLKYGEIIKKNNYTMQAIVQAAHLSDSYGAEVGKGVRIYESILNKEYGIAFGDSMLSQAEELNNNILPKREPRTKKIHPLNCIIYGAPGTGKTYATAEYAQAIISNVKLEEFKKSHPNRQEVMTEYNKLVESGQVVFTTFHQSYGYEEFIQGLRPDTKASTMTFKTIDGVFKRIADKALKDNENNYVIIIDEINRANISKVFGELITLIEEDKRWGELNQISANLQSGDIFAVPNNLYILGTMNSADKSISLIDAALRRRFEFVEQKPKASLVTNDTLRSVLEKINSSLADQLDSADLLIGHSYFMNRSEDELGKILNNSIIPLLYEYFYDNKKKVMNVLGNAIDDTDYIVEDDKLGRIFVERQSK